MRTRPSSTTSSLCSFLGVLLRRHLGSLPSSLALLVLALLATGPVAAAQSGTVAIGWNDFGQCNVPPLPTGLCYVSCAVSRP